MLTHVSHFIIVKCEYPFGVMLMVLKPRVCDSVCKRWFPLLLCSLRAEMTSKQRPHMQDTGKCPIQILCLQIKYSCKFSLQESECPRFLVLGTLLAPYQGLCLFTMKQLLNFLNDEIFKLFSQLAEIAQIFTVVEKGALEFQT